MSRPARFVAPDDTVAHAMVLCQRHRQSGIQVGGRRRLVGIVTREDLDKAIGHGLSNAPVKAIMSSDVVTCSRRHAARRAAPPRRRVQAGRVPVIRDGEVIGVVTRGDVLRALGEPEPERGREEASTSARMLMALPGLEPVFEAIQAVSEPFDGVYLVGGTVRDILLGEERLRPRHRRGGRRDRARTCARRGARRAGRPAREVRHGDREVAGRPGRRRDDTDRVLRRARGAADRRAGHHPPGPVPARLHRQRDGRLAEGRATSAALSTSSAAWPTSSRASSGSSTTSRSSTIRRGSSGRSATRTATASGWTATPSRSRAPASRWASSASSPRRGCATSSWRCCSGAVRRRLDPPTRRARSRAVRSTRISPSTRRRSQLIERRRRAPRALRAGRAGVAPAARRARAPASAGRAPRLVRPAPAAPARRRPHRRRGDGRPEAPGPARSASSDRRGAPAASRRTTPTGALLALALPARDGADRLAASLLRRRCGRVRARDHRRRPRGLGLARVAAGRRDARRSCCAASSTASSPAGAKPSWTPRASSWRPSRSARRLRPAPLMDLRTFLLLAPCVLMSLALHELAHAWVAWRARRPDRQGGGAGSPSTRSSTSTRSAR